MLSLNQCISSAMYGDSEFISLKEFNLRCDQVTDYMAAVNIAFADILTYIQIVSQSQNMIYTAIETFITKDKGNFDDLASSLYTNLAKSIVALAASAKMAGYRSYEQHYCSLSKSKLSPIPGYNLISYAVNAYLGRGIYYETVDKPITVIPILNLYTKIAGDPAYGQCRYGVLPYVVPLVDDDDGKHAESIIYLHHFAEARKAFDEAVNISALVNQDEEVTESFKIEVEKCASNLHSAFLHIAYFYNSDMTINLPPFKKA